MNILYSGNILGLWKKVADIESQDKKDEHKGDGDNLEGITMDIGVDKDEFGQIEGKTSK